MKTLRTAALLAAIGTLLLTLMYGINNVIPILRNLDVVAPTEAAVVFYDTIVPMIVWSIFFLLLWRGREIRTMARVTAIVALAGPLLMRLLREAPTLTLLSLDSIQFVVTGVAWAGLWIWLLLLWARRGLQAPGASLVAVMLLVLTALRALLEVPPSVFSIADALGGQLAAFWEIDPGQAFWRLLAVPGIRIYYWFSQVLFLLAARAAARPAAISSPSASV